jgi:nucleotide-binding universal stress UspA family protein
MSQTTLIVHPTDFSDATEPAFELALENALTLRAELVLVHVMEPMPALADEMYVARRMQIRVEEEAAARKQLDRLLARAKQLEIPASDVLVEGAAAEAIVQAAHERGAALIVMGTHGRTGVRKMFLGSVAERVVATAPCPVLTVRMK